MKLKRLIALALVAGLVVGGTSAADAKKRKKKKARKKVVLVEKSVNYYISRAPESTCPDAAAAFLSIKKTAGEGGCGHAFYGLIAEVLITAGQEGLLDPAGLSPHATSYAAVDGVPLTLDAKKEIAGEVVVGAWRGANDVGAQAGLSRLEVTLLGTAAGAEKVIGTQTVEYQVVPGAPVKVEFSFPADESLDKASFSALTLSLRNRGASAFHGFYSSAGDSFVTVPTIAKKVVRR